MEKLGTVVEIHNNMAKINIIRDSACGENCAACGLCQNCEMTVTLPVVEGLKTGDCVKLLSDDAVFLKNTAIGYVSLTLLLILGGILGSLWGNEWLSFSLALIFVCIGVLVIRKFCPGEAQIHIEKITR
ncbi:MAG: SoxR reducing system RseC family protein [Clostridia bacterium]|nr:SoxR reducing system RseC family protein [Clostridia bacterium]